MAEYDPPIFDVPVFNPAYFINEDEITKSYLRNNFLEFPIGQGLQTVPDLRIENDKINLGLSTISGTDSVAIGHSATASDTEAVAIGHNSNANGNESIAIGHNSSALEDGVVVGHNSTAEINSVVFGHNNTCGENSVVLGHSSTADGDNCIAIGRSCTTSTNDNAIAIGKNATSATFSTALGETSNASGNGSLSCGVSSTSSGKWSTAIGRNTVSSGDSSVAIGNGAVATDDNEIKLGSVASFNGSVANGMILGDVGVANETGLQHINLSKNGTNYALSQTNAGNTRINGVGSVGIRLNNNGLVYFTNTLHIQTAGISYDGTSIPSTANNMIGFRWKASTSQIMVAVDNVLNGVCANVSDRRMKTNIVDYTDGLTGIMKLKPKQYDILKIDVGNCDFTGDNCIIRDMCGNTIEYDSEGNCCDDTEISGEKITGLILDEVRPIFPEVCIGGDDNSIGTLNYAGLVPMLIKAVQEQQEQIEALKIEIEKLKIST